MSTDNSLFARLWRHVEACNNIASPAHLIPFRIGEPIPKITWDAATHTSTLAWPDQTDTLVFSSATSPAGERTLVNISRNGAEILSSPARP